MKRTGLLIGLCLALFVVGGCGSPLIDVECDRAAQGVILAKDHVDTLVNALHDQLGEVEARDYDAMDDELYAVVKGQLEGVEFDREWLREHRAALDAIRADVRAREKALDLDRKNAWTNLDQITHGLVQIKRLRRAFSVTDELKVQVDSLATQVQQLIQAMRENKK